MTEQEIITAIAEYNAAEAAQSLRRRAIFEAVQARKNYRRIGFKAVSWNSWDLHSSGVDNTLERHDQTIIEYSLGTE